MSTFQSFITAGIGNTPSSVFIASSNSIVIGLDIANVNGSNAAITVDIQIHKGVNSAYYLKGAPIPAGSTLQVISGQKVVLNSGDYITVTASAALSADATISLLAGV